MELEQQNEELRIIRSNLEDGLKRYTELFDFAPIGYATLNPRHELHELNHAAAKLLEQERGRLGGTAFTRLVTDCDGPRLDLALSRAQRRGSQQRVEITLKNGKLVSLSIAALDDERTLLAIEDVTERRANEARLAQTETALRQADRRKDEFLAMLSHELRNPLSPIRNCIFLLSHHCRQHEQLPNPADQALEIMERQVAHMARMVDDLLDVTRIGRGKIQLQKSLTDLSELVARGLEDQRASFDAAHIQLKYTADERPIWVDADAARLTQVLSNVLGNAEKFTPSGGCVTVKLSRTDTSAALRIRDTGSGIAPEVLENVFEPFAQAPQTMERSRGGLGLGLSMVKGLVELHGGTVAISSPGHDLGTEVTIVLPTMQPRSSQVALERGPRPQPRRRVLVIEDNEDSADTLGHALTVVGHDVKVSYDGWSGLTCAHEFQPEIVLCDIGLPDMDGYEVARKFREDAELRGVFLVALTGYAASGDLQQALAAGFDEHVAKPPTIERLNAILARFGVRAQQVPSARPDFVERRSRPPQ